MKPFKLSPAFQGYLWGGTRLRDEFGKQCDLEKVAESWELSCHPDGPSRVADGPDAGLTLRELAGKAGSQMLGSRCGKFADFPILIKLIDAKEPLSVQVHPDNDYARRVEGEYGKTEMWYVVDCEPGASLIYGFQKEISKEEFRRRIEDNTLLEVVNQVPVHKGDTFFIQSGTLHAIGAGILIAEIQQNSNTTYRVYDYGRVGADGKTRPLHIDKALDVTTLTPPVRPVGPQEAPKDHGGFVESLLASCDYFTVRELTVKESYGGTAGSESFHAVLALTDGLTLCRGGDAMPLNKGDSVFIPAGSGDYRLAGEGQALLTTL